MKRLVSILFLAFASSVSATEYFVSKDGSNSNDGLTRQRSFLTIQRAADLAQPGDVVTVYEGVYREHVNPKVGGLNELHRITYQAADDNKVVIKGLRASREVATL